MKPLFMALFKNKKKSRFIYYIQELRKKSQYLFLKEEAGQALKLTNAAALIAIIVLLGKEKLRYCPYLFPLYFEVTQMLLLCKKV